MRLSLLNRMLKTFSKANYIEHYIGQTGRTAEIRNEEEKANINAAANNQNKDYERVCSHFCIDFLSLA